MRPITSFALTSALLLVLTACSDDDAATTTTSAPATTTIPATTTTTTAAAPVLTGPSSLSANPQTSDGTEIVVASVELASPGFIGVHADADGSPGAIIGHSELLPEGASTDVVVVLDVALEASTTVWPMVHIDMNGNGIYEFDPASGTTTDVPGTTADGAVAVIPVEITVEAMAAGPIVTTATGDLGEILVDEAGFSLYVFMPDNQGPSTCYDACASTWPPLVGTVTPGAGLDPELLGTVERDDGTVQATYHDWPLYYYAPDDSPGDTLGQGVGGVWWVVSPEGDPVME
jgi:predicted lipoprotein with Yx(FWY)xxD motif